MTEPAHILVVDDDQSIRRMLQLLLHDAGYRVSSAGSGEEALAYIDLVTPDLILLDLMLPGVSGREVARRIKSVPHRPFIPIILVTARSDQQSKVSGLDAGADDFLVKPIEFAELLARVRALLRLQRSQRSLRAEQRKTELLLHLTRELGTTLDLDELLTHFLERLADAVGAARASIILTANGRARFYSSSRDEMSAPPSEVLTNGAAGWALRERMPLVINDTANDERWLTHNTQHRTTRSAAVAPIIREGQALGVLTLVHHTPGHFTKEHLDLLASVTAQCAITLENAELFQLTRAQKELLERRTEELQRLNEVSRHLTELMQPELLMRLVTHLVHYTFGYPSVSILLREGDELVVRAVAGRLGLDDTLDTRIQPDGMVAGAVLAQQQPLSVSDLHSDPTYQPSSPDSPVRSELAVPIITGRDVFGVLDVASDKVAAFGPSDERLLGTLASQLGVALENARLFEAEKRRVRQLGQVNHLSIAITARLDLAQNLQIAADALATIFDLQRCGIVVPNDDQFAGMWVTSSNTQLATPHEAIDRTALEPATYQLLTLAGPQLIISADADERLAPLMPLFRPEGIEALALAPLLSAGRQIGILFLDLTNDVERFGQAELTLLETVASLVAQSIENSRLYRTVEDERRTLNAVLDGAADPILLISPNEHVLLSNRAAAEQLTLGAANGQPVSALVTNADLLQALQGSPSDNGNTAHEVSLPDGKTFSISVAPVRRGGNELIGRVAVLQDITAIKLLERQEQERLRSVFRRYVSPQVVEQVLAGQGDFGSPVERQVAVLFADLRGYTALTEGIEARVLVEQVLNRYFTVMTEVLYRYEGTIDKFLGDGIIGVFGTPIAHHDDLARALKASVDLQRAFGRLRQQWNAELGLDIGMGIGLGYGPAIVGNIGSTQRLDFTLIGDVVNTANRLNGVARAGQIIVSHALIEALPPDWRAPWPLRLVGRVPLKGKQEPHLVYDVEYQQDAEAP